MLNEPGNDESDLATVGLPQELKIDRLAICYDRLICKLTTSAKSPANVLRPPLSSKPLVHESDVVQSQQSR